MFFFIIHIKWYVCMITILICRIDSQIWIKNFQVLKYSFLCVCIREQRVWGTTKEIDAPTQRLEDVVANATRVQLQQSFLHIIKHTQRNSGVLSQISCVCDYINQFPTNNNGPSPMTASHSIGCGDLATHQPHTEFSHGWVKGNRPLVGNSSRDV